MNDADLKPGVLRAFCPCGCCSVGFVADPGVPISPESVTAVLFDAERMGLLHPCEHCHAVPALVPASSEST